MADQEVEQIRLFFSNKSHRIGKEGVSLFCAGSIGRGDCGRLSDIDLYGIDSGTKPNSHKRRDKKLETYLKKYCSQRKFDEPSTPYTKIYYIGEMLEKAGSPKDDNENLFTVRMLLLLESRPIQNESAFRKYLEQIVSLYFREKSTHENFMPLFLLNDILRWWRTVCLNYETRRNDITQPWRKKNINLKFSRMLTVYATVLTLITNDQITSREFVELCLRPPLERLAIGFAAINDKEMISVFSSLLNTYERFIQIKETKNIDDFSLNDEIKNEICALAKTFKDGLFCALWHKNIDEKYKKFLVI